jgi:hypothetical protein
MPRVTRDTALRKGQNRISWCVFSQMNGRFTAIEYAEIRYISELCECNSRTAVDKYCRRIPNRRSPNQQIFINTKRRIRESRNQEQECMLDTAQRNRHQCCHQWNFVLDII